jgi:hypothetical protein
MLGGTQWASLVQVVRQAPVPHAYGEQETVDGVVQVPLALQVDVGVSVDPVQADGVQVVPVA